MTDQPIQRQCDLPFSVPFLHRLRFTDDICGPDFDVLLELLDGGEQGRARVLLVTETALEASAAALVGRLRAAESVELVADPLRIEGGEDSKNSVDAIKYLLQQFNAANLDRRSYVVVIGGGALLDAVGFAAAIAHRGIRLVRLPTTTLAQADSGVGVKNAINFFDKKNWIGTFAVPWAVCNDLRLLESLPDRDFRSGFSEAVKVSLLKDPRGFDWLCDHANDIRGRSMSVVQNAIHRSCMLHLRHITAGGDPFEMLEARPLDFGHWSAHRLEPLTQFQLRHGEAVALGVAIDCIYSSRMFGFPEHDALRVYRCLSQLGMQLWHPLLLPAERLMQGLEEFRQHLGGRLTITMLRRIGEPINVHQIDANVMKESIESLQTFASRRQVDQAAEIEPAQSWSGICNVDVDL
jgi:3-dehydroquinate synthase